MGKWEVACNLNKEVFVTEEDMTICQVHGGLEERGLLAKQICLMRNEGVELLNKNQKIISDLQHSFNKEIFPDWHRILTEAMNENDDLLKRMGVDCE